MVLAHQDLLPGMRSPYKYLNFDFSARKQEVQKIFKFCMLPALTPNFQKPISVHLDSWSKMEPPYKIFKSDKIFLKLNRIESFPGAYLEYSGISELNIYEYCSKTAYFDVLWPPMTPEPQYNGLNLTFFQVIFNEKSEVG